jgi:hypothetical protein
MIAVISSPQRFSKPAVAQALKSGLVIDVNAILNKIRISFLSICLTIVFYDIGAYAWQLDGVSSSLESLVVCDDYLRVERYIPKSLPAVASRLNALKF